jgi:hypothetical protein
MAGLSKHVEALARIGEIVGPLRSDDFASNHLYAAVYERTGITRAAFDAMDDWDVMALLERSQRNAKPGIGAALRRPSQVHRSSRDVLTKRRFGSERDVEALTGIPVKTLQKDRLLGCERFPSYRAGKRVLYDLDEIEQVIRSSRDGRKTP